MYIIHQHNPKIVKVACFHWCPCNITNFKTATVPVDIVVIKYLGWVAPWGSGRIKDPGGNVQPLMKHWHYFSNINMNNKFRAQF